jgi:hypothetical protein
VLDGTSLVSGGGEEPKISSRELSTAGFASLWVELIVVAGGDGGAESAELESVLGEVGIAWTGDGAFF